MNDSQSPQLSEELIQAMIAAGQLTEEGAQQLRTLRQLPAPATTPQDSTTVQGSANVTATHDGLAVGGNVEKLILVENRALLKEILGDKAPDLKDATDVYLRHLLAKHRYLNFRGFGISERVPLKLPLLKMYVPLNARIEMPEGETCIWRGEALRRKRRKQWASASAGPNPCLTCCKKTQA